MAKAILLIKKVTKWPGILRRYYHQQLKRTQQHWLLLPLPVYVRRYHGRFLMLKKNTKRCRVKLRAIQHCSDDTHRAVAVVGDDTQAIHKCSNYDDDKAGAKGPSGGGSVGQ